MKKTIILLLFVFISNSIFSQDWRPKQGDPVDAFSRELRFMGIKFDRVEKISQKYAKKYGGVSETYTGFKGKKIVQTSWTSPSGNYHVHRWYFSGGPFCEGYQYITSYSNHYSLLRKSFEFAADKEYGNFDIKKTREGFQYSVFEIPTMETYYSRKNRLYVAFGGEHNPEGQDLYKIEIYRGGIF